MCKDMIFYKFVIILLQFIKFMIYFSKLIDICINCQESQKVVNNYVNGTIRFIKSSKSIDKSIFYFIKKKLPMLQAILNIAEALVKIFSSFFIL